MKERLRQYVEEVLKDVPRTRETVDLREELIGNMEERYDDLRAEGYGEQDAFDCTINAMGDIRSLFEKEGNQGNGVLREEVLPEGKRPDQKEKSGRAVKVLTVGAVLGGVLFLLGAGIIVTQLGNGKTSREGTGAAGRTVSGGEGPEQQPGAVSGTETAREISGTDQETGETRDLNSSDAGETADSGQENGNPGEDGWTSTPEGGIMEQKFPAVSLENLSIGYECTDLTVELAGGDELVLTETYKTDLEKILKTEVQTGEGRISVLNQMDQNERERNWKLLWWKDDCQDPRPVSARIQIPESFKGELEIATVSGKVSLPWFEGEKLEIATVSGNVNAGEIYADMEGNSVSGDMTIEKAAREVSVGTVSGDLTIGEAAGGVSAETTSGSLMVGESFGDISMVSVSGDMGVERVQSPGFAFEAEWLSGKLDTDFWESLNQEPGSAAGTVSPGEPGGKDHGKREEIPRIKFVTLSGDIRCRTGR